MPANMKQKFLSLIQSGLQRKGATKCSRWAELYRIMGGTDFSGPWTFTHHPWLKDMHDSEAELNVGQKSAQMGYTETVLNITFYNIDVKGNDCLYVLPAKTPDAGDFSSGRFGPALELSPHLENLFSDVNNVGHKRAGAAGLYIRGSRSRAGLKSVPVNFIVLDEVDEMTQENIPLALERTAGQLTKLVWMISTPTLDGYGINKFFQLSSQNHFFFKCPSCSRFIELTFPDSLVIIGDDATDQRIHESYLICTLCKNRLNHEDKSNFLSNNQWIESFSNRDIKGWHISQLYSTTVKPSRIATSFFMAQRDKTEEQELYNSKLGLTHEVEGSRVTDAQIDSVRGDYKQLSTYPGGTVTMGVDVGYPFIHYEIDQWELPSGLLGSIDLNVLSKLRVIKYGKVRDFSELDLLMNQFKISYCVIDAHPERRQAYEFASRFWGHVRLAFYVSGLTGKQLHIGEQAEPTVSADRTSWLDLSLGRFRARTMTLPADIDTEYRNQIKALTRIYTKDKHGNPIGRYENGTLADHYAHARNYAEIALQLAVNLSNSRSIGSIL